MADPQEDERAGAEDVDVDVDADGDDAVVAPVEHRLAVDREGAGERIDALVAARIEALSRAQVQRLIEDGQVTVNGLPLIKAGQRARLGDAVAVVVPPPAPIEVVAEDLPL